MWRIRHRGPGGDVTVSQGEKTVLTIEVTERAVDRNRVVATFRTKILRAGIVDYLFVYSAAAPRDDAREAAERYFSQGHEINFLQVKEWILHNLGTMGSRGRALFMEKIVQLLDSSQVPAVVKVRWNEILESLVAN